MKDPIGPIEWQNAVDAAHGALALDAARQYGLVKGGPKVNAARCVLILQRGKRLGYLPRHEALDGFIRALCNPSGR